MTGPAGPPPQNIFNPTFDFMDRTKQRHRIEIALHGHIMAQRRPGLIQRNAPINADHGAAGFPHQT